MSLTVNYSIHLERVDADSGIRSIQDITGTDGPPESQFGDNTLMVADGDVDKVMYLVAPTVDVLSIQSDTPITIKLNSTATTPIPGVTVFYLNATNITALYFSNSSGKPATVRFINYTKQTITPVP